MKSSCGAGFCGDWGTFFAGVGVAIVVDGVEAAEKKGADVGEGGSAAGRDASAGEQLNYYCTEVQLYDKIGS